MGQGSRTKPTSPTSSSDALQAEGILVHDRTTVSDHSAEIAAALTRLLAGEIDFLIVEPTADLPDASASEETRLTLDLFAELQGYVQFEGRLRKKELYCEAAGSENLPGEMSLTEAQEAQLGALGWERPTKKRAKNWHRVVAKEDVDVNVEARRTLATLCEVYGAKPDETRAQRRMTLAATGLSEERANAISSLPEGPYSVVITGAAGRLERASLSSQLRHLGFDDPDQVLDRAMHIRPEVVAPGISERTAIELKKQLEAAGARVRIEEEAVHVGPREPVPQQVRREVWRRDQGRCVVCGSQERLEFDHIIPVSRGGSNTVRNIELRCEYHNRSKGAEI